MDLNILIWVNNNLHGSGVLNSIWKFITTTGDTGFIWIILCLVMLCMKHTRKSGFVMLLSLGFSFVACDMIIKNLILRARPFENNPEFINFINGIGYSLPDSTSFPSGHAASSFAVAFSLFLCNKKWGVPSLIWGALVALSRVYMCVHYPTDVIAGIALGITVAYLSYFVVHEFLRWYYRKYTQNIKINEMIERGRI